MVWLNSQDFLILELPRMTYSRSYMKLSEKERDGALNHQFSGVVNLLLVLESVKATCPKWRTLTNLLRYSHPWARDSPFGKIHTVFILHVLTSGLSQHPQASDSSPRLKLSQVYARNRHASLVVDQCLETLSGTSTLQGERALCLTTMQGDWGCGRFFGGLIVE